MCLIIHAPPGIAIPAALVADAATRNADGVGAIVISHKSKRNKSATAERSVNRTAADTVAYVTGLPTDTERVVHLRMATHGSRNLLKHAHPFALATSGAYLMHNGVIRELGESLASNGESDTEELARHLGKLDAPSLIAVWPLLCRTTLHGQRVAAVLPTGRILWAGRDLGRKCEGLWLSNSYACGYGVAPVVQRLDTLPLTMPTGNASRYAPADGPGWLSRQDRRAAYYARKEREQAGDISQEAKDLIKDFLPDWSCAMD